MERYKYKSRGIINYGDWNYNPPNPPQFPNQFAYQYWNMDVDPIYTTLFINLVDGFNEMGQNFNPFPIGTVDDQVFGYNLGTMQANYLKFCYGHSSLMTRLKANRPSGVTDAQIDLLFTHY